MPLADCVIATSAEVVDPTLVIAGMSFAGTSIIHGGEALAGIAAGWTVPTNPYITAVQIQYGPQDLTASPIVISQPAAVGTWMTTTAIASGKLMQARYRAVGISPLVGPWSSSTNFTAGLSTSPMPAQPGASAWSATGSGITGSGVTFPAINIAGALDTTGVTGINFYFRLHGGASMTAFGSITPSQTGILIDSVASGLTYDFGVTYQNGETEGPIRIYTNGGSGYTVSGFAASGVTDDKTPNAIAWADISASGSGLQTAYSSVQTFSGINVPITLTLNYTNTATWYYNKNGSTTSFSSGAQISVVAGDTLAFDCQKNASVTSVLSIVNHTDADTTLDTITATLTVSGFTAGVVSADITYTPNYWDNGYYLELQYYSCNPQATASGGVGPYTYSWAVLSGSVSLSSATSATCFVLDSTGNGCTLQCTITDTGAGGATGMTPVVTCHT